MKTLLCALLLILTSHHFSAQSILFSNIQYKRHFPTEENWEFLKLKETDSIITCMKYYFQSDDTLYFREYPSERIHKISKKDLEELPFALGKDYHLAKRNQNLNAAALKPKILLGLSAASLAGIAIDLAQPNPIFFQFGQVYFIPILFLASYVHAKKMDRYLNYYQFAENQKFSRPVQLKPEQQRNLPEELANQKNQGTTQGSQIEQNSPSVKSIPSQDDLVKPGGANISDAYRYGTTGEAEAQILRTNSGCVYKLSNFYFQSDGYYFVGIQDHPGTYRIEKSEVSELSGVYKIGRDRQFARKKAVVPAAKFNKVMGVMYGIGGTIIGAAAVGFATYSVAGAVFGGIGIGVLPAVLIISKSNKTIKYYEMFKTAPRISCENNGL
jgi:hypothetical protein